MKATLIGAQRDNGYYDDTAVVERAGGAVVELRWLGGVMEERPARPNKTYVQLGARGAGVGSARSAPTHWHLWPVPGLGPHTKRRAAASTPPPWGALTSGSLDGRGAPPSWGRRAP